MWRYELNSDPVRLSLPVDLPYIAIPEPETVEALGRRAASCPPVVSYYPRALGFQPDHFIPRRPRRNRGDGSRYWPQRTVLAGDCDSEPWSELPSPSTFDDDHDAAPPPREGPPRRFGSSISEGGTPPASPSGSWTLTWDSPFSSCATPRMRFRRHLNSEESYPGGDQ